MKKLVFTAIAMIAFSSASMANTVEANNDGEATPCKNHMIDLYEAMVGPNEDDIELLNALLNVCK